MEDKKKSKRIIFKDLFVKEKYKLFRIIICSLFIILIITLSFFMSGNKYINKINYNEYINLYNGDNKSIVVFSRTDCSHCKEYLPLVNKISREKRIIINHFDITMLVDDDYNNVWNSIPNFKNYLDNNEPVIPTPVTVILQKGEVIAYLEGNVSRDKLVSFLTINEIIK